MLIRIDDLTGSDIAALLDEHIADMRSVSPPESVRRFCADNSGAGSLHYPDAARQNVN